MSTSAASDRRLIDTSLFTTIEVDGGDAEVRLAGSRCVACGAVAFPAQSSCARCAGQDVESHALASSGVIWASTVQRFTPKAPYLKAAGEPAPYGVGYVDLAGEVLVESRLLGPVERCVIGTPVTLTLEELPGADGSPVWTFAFEPTKRDQAGGQR